jgi:hypothetical protein
MNQEDGLLFLEVFLSFVQLEVAIAVEVVIWTIMVGLVLLMLRRGHSMVVLVVGRQLEVVAVVVVSPDVAVDDQWLVWVLSLELLEVVVVVVAVVVEVVGLSHGCQLEVVVVVVAVVVEGIEAVVQLVVLIPCEILKKKSSVVL